MTKDIIKSITWGITLLCLLASITMSALEVTLDLWMRIGPDEMQSCQILRKEIEPNIKKYQDEGPSFLLLQQIHNQWIARGDCRVSIPDQNTAFEPFSTECNQEIQFSHSRVL